MDAAGFWTGIFGVNFAIGVATGIVMEFEFGTNVVVNDHHRDDRSAAHRLIHLHDLLDVSVSNNSRVMFAQLNRINNEFERTFCQINRGTECYAN